MNDDASRASSTEAPENFLLASWRRLKEHRIAQWTVGYVAVAYGIQHAVTLTSEAYEWPNIVARLSMTLLVIGLPVAMTLAWYHGEKASRRVSGPELTIISLLLLTSSLLFAVLVHPAGITTPRAQEASVTAARVAAASPKGAISVAVLPFLNLSADKEQEFFSDGMTEEITAALAKVPDLRVVARTSAFEFKGKNVNVKTMGHQLGATHLIEGSVRKAGNRLRITAQLIKADDGTHIWAEDYDRELTDIFTVQEDIARTITASLHMTLGLKPGENLVNNRDIDSDSYEKFLRARALYQARGSEPTNAQELRNSAEALALLESVIAKNPNYAPGWNALGGAYAVQLNNITGDGGSIEDARRAVDELRPKGEDALQKAIRLDSNLADPYVLLAYFARSRGNLIAAEEFLKKSLALDPFREGAIFGFGILYGSVGRIKDGLEFYEKARAIDPLLPQIGSGTARERWINGQSDSAIALAKTLRLNSRPLLASIYTSQGRFGEAADALTELANGNGNSNVATAARLLRMMPQKLPSPADLPQLTGGDLTMLYLYLGAPERVLSSYERTADIGYIQGNTEFVWYPALAPVRKTERFKALVRRVGLVDYWRAKGWPSQCHPTIGDDFVCN